MALQQFLLRFNDPFGNPQDLQIQQGPDGGFRLSTHDKGYLEPVHSTATNVAISSTESLYTETFVTESFITQFYLNGNTDAVFTIKKNGSLIGKKKTWYMQQDCLYELHKPVYFDVGDLLLIEVTNIGVQIADYETIVYKEN
jgi:hypothetical protein